MPLSQLSFLTLSDPTDSPLPPHTTATATMRSFRLEAQLSWDSFNWLWRELCNLLNSPFNDVLLTQPASSPEYAEKLEAVVQHVLQSGVFGAHTQGRWQFGRHEEERHCAMIVDYIGRLVAYAAGEIMAQVMAHDEPCEIKADKVGAWLMNKDATMWDDYQFVNREESAAQADDGDDEGDDNTIVPRSRSPSLDPTMIPETVFALTSVAQSVYPDDEVPVLGLFD